MPGKRWDHVLGAWDEGFEPAPKKQDGWTNPFTGFGIVGRDRTQAGFFSRSFRLDDEQLSAMYYGDDLAATLVDTFPTEMLRQGYTVDDDEDEALLEEGKKLDVDCRIQEGLVWGGLFGGALLIMGFKGGNPQMPAPESPRGLAFLNVVDRRHVTVERWYSDPMAPKFGQPEIYRISSIEGKSYAIHESWTVRFEGPKTDPYERRQLSGWTYSVLQRPYEAMRQFSGAWQSAGHLLSEASIGVFKLDGLMGQIASGQLKNLQTRMVFADMSKSTMRSLMLDSKNEDYSRVNTTLAGASDLLDRFMMRMSAASGIPVSVLMGRSAAGMNATGESDFRSFYGAVASRQTKELKPILERVWGLIAGRPVEIDFNPLWQPTAQEESAIDKTIAETDAIYEGLGLRGEAIILKRFRNTDFLDDDQEKILEEALKNPPEPTPEEMAALNGQDPQNGDAPPPGGTVREGTKAPVPSGPPNVPAKPSA